MRRPLVLLLLVPLLAACPGDDSPTVSAGDGTTTTSSSTSTTAFEPTALPASAPAGTTRGYLKDVRVAAQAGFDRVVFEFEDALPGYEVTTTQPPVTEDGSGDEVRVQGDALLQVRFENAAAARIEGERVIEVYAGPDRVRADGTAVVTEAVDVGDFEGVVTWVIGLRRSSEVRLSTLASPHRLVVDVLAES
jgi:hypothetical protein